MAMWGRKEPEEAKPQPKPTTPPPAPAKAPEKDTAPARPVETTPAAPQPAAPSRGAGMDQQSANQRKAILGPSIQVKGELIGNEDLVIEGRVEGVVRLREHHLTIGKSAQVQATLEAKAIRVEGNVNGDVQAGERVELAAGSTVVGDITAPRIIISDGARFKGSVDMDRPQSAGGAKPGGGPTATTQPVSTEKAGEKGGSPVNQPKPSGVPS